MNASELTHEYRPFGRCQFDYSTRLLELAEYKVSEVVVEYLVDKVIAVVDAALARTNKSLRGKTWRRSGRGTFELMVEDVIKTAGTQMPVVLAILVYLDRADKARLKIARKEYANEIIFVGALVVAHKYLNEKSFKTEDWADIIRIFSRRNINDTEQQFLEVLDWKLLVKEEEILAHYDALVEILPAPYRDTPHCSIPFPTILELPQL